MPILLFSGGIDSTTLAFDIAKNPHRYGIAGGGSLLGAEWPTLLLVTHGTGEGKFGEDIAWLVSILKQSGVKLDIAHEWVNSSGVLRPYPPSRMPAHGHSSLHPYASGYKSDILSLPYTSGLHTWLAAVCTNWVDTYDGILGSSEFSNPKVFFGFQWDGPIWEVYDDGRNTPTDTTPQFIDALNVLSKAAGGPTPVEFCAPFLHNRMDRRMIVELARDLEVPLHATSSCAHGWGVNCGKCHQCLIRYAALKEA